MPDKESKSDKRPHHDDLPSAELDPKTKEEIRKRFISHLDGIELSMILIVEGSPDQKRSQLDELGGELKALNKLTTELGLDEED